MSKGGHAAAVVLWITPFVSSGVSLGRHAATLDFADGEQWGVEKELGGHAAAWITLMVNSGEKEESWVDMLQPGLGSW